jgi:hypothetical protein
MDQEKRNAVRWFHSHECTDKNKTLRLDYTPTGLGFACRVICSCGKVKDVTDYRTW